LLKRFIFFLCFFLCPPDDDKDTGHDLQRISTASILGQAFLEVSVKRLRTRQRGLRGEHHFSGLRREFTTGLG
jgi:hypothetical protein